VRIAAHYSHLNGLEYLLVHKPHLWDEIRTVISAVDAESHRTKVSKEKRIFGKLLYSPKAMNSAVAAGFRKLYWEERRVSYFVTDDERLIRRTMLLSRSEQKAAIEAAGKVPFPSYNQTDFVRDRCMVEVQFGKYAFVAHDLFVKHMAFYTTDHMDVGIEILPMKSLQAQMSSGVPYYEGGPLRLDPGGSRRSPCPLVLVGLEPDARVSKAALEKEALQEEKAIEAGLDPRQER